RVYENGVCFKPGEGEKVGESLNLWKGFNVDPKKGDWSLMQDLILKVLCRDEQASFNYVLDWMGRAVQLPGKPATTAIVFKGIKGTGKSTVAEAFTYLFGMHGLDISSTEQISGRFNAHLQHVVALFADEAYYAGDRAGESRLKALITEKSLTYEAK